MVGEVRIVYRLTTMLAGLCLLLSACATPPGAAPARTAPPVSVQQPPEPVGAQAFPVPVPADSSAVKTSVLARIALLLPMQSETLGTAASAVRDGFMAAAALDANDAIWVETVESGDAVPDMLAAYATAARDFDIVVGPLPRSGVNAIVQSGAVTKPTVALTQVDAPEDAKAALPKKLLMMGLSIEDEARQMAAIAHRGKPAGTAIALATPAPWQQRAANAFSERWQQLGYAVETMELDIAAQGTYLGANGLIQLQKRLQEEQPSFLFSALDAVQTRQLRMLIGSDIPVYGTSQLNPLTLAQWPEAEPLPEMNGVRLVDLPWQLQPDHPAVMAYAPAAASSGHARNADLERLYALGIDAFRVVKEIAQGQTQFQIDGVTGKLQIRFDKDASRFERIETPAVYHAGRVVPVSGMR